MGPDWFEELKKLNIDNLLKEMVQNGKAELKTVNILIAGKSGVGKSTLINAVFGKDVATVGKGRPVTTEITWYDSPTLPLRLCDTKGLELASHKATVEALKKEIQRCHQSGKIEEGIHVAWLCISEPSARVEDGEIEVAELCAANNIPVIVVLTKAIGDDEFAEVVAELVPNHKRVIRVLAETWRTKALQVEAFGLYDLVEATTALVPSVVEKAFIAAQRIDFERKRSVGYNIASASALMAGGGAWVPVPGASPGSFISINIGMLVSIALAFGLEVNLNVGAAIAAAAISSLGISFGLRWGAGELLKLIPGIGTAAGSALEMGTAAASTYTIGIAFTEFLASFEQTNERKPSPDELKDGFITYWRNTPNKQVTPPKETPGS